jgi:hypothetical protein
MFTYTLKAYLQDAADVREPDSPVKPRLVKSTGKLEATKVKIVIRRRK